MTNDAIQEKLDSIDDKLDRIVYWMDGNGRDGAVVRLDRIEQREKSRYKLLWVVIGASTASMVAWVQSWIWPVR